MAETDAVASSFRSGFQVESYLEHQGRKFIERFDANSYLHITQAMDEYSLVERHGTLEEAFAPIRARMMVVALSSDWLFPPAQSREIANALLRAGKRVSYCLLHAPHGHDAFLVAIENLAEAVRAFLPWVTKDVNGALEGVEEHTVGTARRRPQSAEPVPPGRRREFEIITDMIEPGSRVLDLGCGDGDLLSRLARAHDVAGIGVDIDIQHVIDVIDKGHDVFQGDIDDGLAMIPDRAYDYAILGETLPVVRKPRFVLREMLRVARVGIVSFPNFGNLSHRLYLWVRGRMPKGGALPFAWYDTPNIHLFTRQDFVDLCREDGITIRDMVCIPKSGLDRCFVRARLCNLGADRVLAQITRGDAGARTPCRSHAPGGEA
jgi:homoserine O-acetyltransferase